VEELIAGVQRIPKCYDIGLPFGQLILILGLMINVENRNKEARSLSIPTSILNSALTLTAAHLQFIQDSLFA
jgi:hypothetical protein